MRHCLCCRLSEFSKEIPMSLHKKLTLGHSRQNRQGQKCLLWHNYIAQTIHSGFVVVPFLIVTHQPFVHGGGVARIPWQVGEMVDRWSLAMTGAKRPKG